MNQTGTTSSEAIQYIMNQADIALNGFIQYIENHIDGAISLSNVRSEIDAIVKFSGLYSADEDSCDTFKSFIEISRESINVENNTINLGNIIGNESRELLKKILTTCSFVKFQHDMIFEYNLNNIMQTPFFRKYINNCVKSIADEIENIENNLISLEVEKNERIETKTILENFIINMNK